MHTMTILYEKMIPSLVFSCLLLLSKAATVVASSSSSSSNNMIEPLDWEIDPNDVEDLRHRLETSRLPELNPSALPGMDVSTMEKITTIWSQKDFDAFAQKVNQDNFIAKLVRHGNSDDDDDDGDNVEEVKIHFKWHKHNNNNNYSKKSTTLLLLHGWPSSLLEFEDTAEYLIKAGYDLVIPSLPNFGFSSKLYDCDIDCIAQLFVSLMEELQVTRYVVAGGDLGAMIAPRLCEIDSSCAGTLVHFVSWGPPFQNKGFFATLDAIMTMIAPTWVADEPDIATEVLFPLLFLWNDMGYLHEHSTRSKTLSFGLNDSPVGLAAWVGEKWLDWSHPNTVIDLSYLVDQLSFYWFTESGGSSTFIYQREFGDIAACVEAQSKFLFTKPFGYANSKDLMRLPLKWIKHYATDVRYYKRLDEYDAAHFLAYEDPELFAAVLSNFTEGLLTTGEGDEETTAEL